MQSSRKFKFSQESTMLRTAARRRTSKTHQEPTQLIAAGHQILIFHHQNQVLFLGELTNRIQSVAYEELKELHHLFKHCLFEVRKETPGGLACNQRFSLVHVLSGCYLSLRKEERSLFFHVALSCNPTEFSSFKVQGPPEQLVKTHLPIRIATSDRLNLCISERSNTNEEPVLSFSEYESTEFVLKHYRKQSYPQQVCNYDVVQVVLQAPVRHLYCQQVQPLLELSGSSHELEQSNKLIKDAYFGPDNYKVCSLEAGEEIDETQTELLAGGYWRVSMPDSSTYQPVNFSQPLRLCSITNGLFLCMADSQSFYLSDKPIPASLFRLSQHTSRLNEPSRCFEECIFDGEVGSLAKDLSVRLLKTRSNGFILEAYVDNLYRLMAAVSQLEVDSRSKAVHAQTLSLLNEQTANLSQCCRHYSDIYDAVIRELEAGCLPQRAFLFEKTLEILKTISRKLRSRSYIELKNGQVESLKAILGQIEQTINGLNVSCFRFLLGVMRKGVFPHEQLAPLYRTILDYDQSHPYLVLATFQLALSGDRSDLYARELTSMGVFGADQSVARHFGSLRLARHVLELTLDRSPTIEYLQNGIHCRLAVVGGALSLLFEGSEPIALSSLSELEILEASECLRLIAINSSPQNRQSLEVVLADHYNLFVEFVLSDTDLRLKTGLLCILYHHASQPRQTTDKPFLFLFEKGRDRTIKGMLTGSSMRTSNAPQRQLIAVLNDIAMKADLRLESLELLDTVVKLLGGYLSAGNYSVSQLQLLEDALIGFCRQYLNFVDEPLPQSQSFELECNILEQLQTSLGGILGDLHEIKRKVKEVSRMDHQWTERSLLSYYELLGRATQSPCLLGAVVALLLQSYREFDEDKSQLVLVKRNSLATDDDLQAIGSAASVLVGMLEQLAGSPYFQKRPSEDLQSSIENQFLRLNSLLNGILVRVEQAGVCAMVKHLQHSMNVMGIHVRLLSVYSAACSQISESYLQPTFHFLELFVRDNEINSRTLLRQAVAWRDSPMERQLMCAVHRFCSVSELEEVLEGMIGFSFKATCRVMLAVQQEMGHSHTSQKRQQLNAYIVEALLQRDPSFGALKGGTPLADPQANPSTVSQPEVDEQEQIAVLFLLAQVAASDALLRRYLSQLFPIEELLGRAKDTFLPLSMRKPFMSLLDAFLRDKPAADIASSLSSYLESLSLDHYSEQVRMVLPPKTTTQPMNRVTEHNLHRASCVSSEQFWQFQFSEAWHNYGHLRFLSSLLKAVGGRSLLPVAATFKLAELGRLLSTLLAAEQPSFLNSHKSSQAEQFLLELYSSGLLAATHKAVPAQAVKTLQAELADFRKLGVQIVYLAEESGSEESVKCCLMPQTDSQLSQVDLELSSDMLKRPIMRAAGHDNWRTDFEVQEQQGPISWGLSQGLNRLLVRMAYLHVTCDLNLSMVLSGGSGSRVPTCSTHLTATGLTWSEETLKNIAGAIDGEQVLKHYSYRCVGEVVKVLQFSKISHLLLAGKLVREAKKGTPEEQAVLLAKIWNRLIDTSDCYSRLNYGARVKILSLVLRESGDVELQPLTEFIRTLEQHLQSDSHLTAELIRCTAEMCAIYRNSPQEGFHPMEYIKELAMRTFSDNFSGYQLLMSILKCEFQECGPRARKQLLERSSASTVLCSSLNRLLDDGIQLVDTEQERLQLLYDSLDLILESALLVDSEGWRATTRLEYLRLLVVIEHRVLVLYLASETVMEKPRLESTLFGVVECIRTVQSALITKSEAYLLQNINNEQRQIEQKELQQLNQQLQEVLIQTGDSVIKVWYRPGRFRLSAELSQQLTQSMQKNYRSQQQLAVELMEGAAAVHQVVRGMHEQADFFRRQVSQNQVPILTVHLLLLLAVVLNTLLAGPSQLSFILLSAALALNLVQLGASWQLLLNNRTILSRMNRKGEYPIPLLECICLVLNCLSFHKTHFSGLLVVLLVVSLDRKAVSRMSSFPNWSISGVLIYLALWNLLLLILYNTYRSRGFLEETIMFLNYQRHPYEYSQPGFKLADWARRCLDSGVLGWWIPTLLLSVLVSRSLLWQQRNSGSACGLCKAPARSSLEEKSCSMVIAQAPRYVQYFAYLLSRQRLLSGLEQRLRQAVETRDSSILPQ